MLAVAVLWRKMTMEFVGKIRVTLVKTHPLVPDTLSPLVIYYI
jgi:hypothetical protein